MLEWQLHEVRCDLVQSSPAQLFKVLRKHVHPISSVNWGSSLALSSLALLFLDF